MTYEKRVRGRYYATTMNRKTKRLEDVVPSRTKLSSIETLVEKTFPGGEWIGGRVLGERFYKINKTLVAVRRF